MRRYPQGNRVLAVENLETIVIMPSISQSLGLQTDFDGSLALQEHQCQSPNEREVLSGKAYVCLVVIFMKRHIERPVQLVFN